MTEPSTGAQQWHRLFPDDPAGGYPHRSLADARSEARRMWDLRSSGIDPRAHRDRLIQTRKDVDAETELKAQRRLSVRALFERWVATDLQPRVRVNGGSINGNGGNNIIVGTRDADSINGGAGNDVLYGSGGDDTIGGGSGSDVIAGGGGNDFLTGGTGSDTFVFDTALSGTTNVDSIVGSAANAADKIALDPTRFAALLGGATAGPSVYP